MDEFSWMITPTVCSEGVVCAEIGLLSCYRLPFIKSGDINFIFKEEILTFILQICIKLIQSKIKANHNFTVFAILLFSHWSNNCSLGKTSKTLQNLIDLKLLNDSVL